MFEYCTYYYVGYMYVLGKMWLFTDEEIWSILAQRKKGQKNSSLVVYSIDSKITINKMTEEACQYGKVMILETALIRGGKTLFIEYNRRVDAELAKSCLSRRFEGQGNE
ncbi:MAG: hypothetical protein EZS28_037642 [Streblomastix strix]|uniref:Uncharacterized protein n=1 Tax=Streblomastix strix TaxID=222440 RepID=A0A5J4UA96_9EUKA|nr:MAG: hypothetical protein EZS28_037642 [Streblomastix strix]